MKRALSFIAFVIVACGGSESPLGPAPEDASTSDATKSDAGGGGVYTLDNVCDLTAALVCSVRKDCCEKTFGFDAATCLSRQKETCAKDVAEVNAGTMTFDGSRIDPCFQSLKPLYDKCTLAVDDFSEAAAILKDCHVFAGKLGEGIACDRDNQCAPSTSADAFVTCQNSTNTCHTIQILGAGANCQLRDGVDAVCGKGLYCDAVITGSPPYQGTCKTALALGAQCTQDKPLQCGLGNYCDATKHCVVGKAGGETCTSNLECASIVCRKGDAGAGTCKPLDPLVKKRECGK